MASMWSPEQPPLGTKPAMCSAPAIATKSRVGGRRTRKWPHSHSPPRPIPTRNAPDARPQAPRAADSNAAASAEAKASLAMPAPMPPPMTSSVPAPAPKLGTGHGEREYSYVNHTEFQRMQAQPNEVIRIRYDSLDNLFAMGIIKRPRPAAPGANPFPASPVQQYVPDPQG